MGLAVAVLAAALAASSVWLGTGVRAGPAATGLQGFYVVWTSPADGASNVSANDSIVVAFSEPYWNTSALSIQVLPYVNIDSFGWSPNGTVLTIAHDPFQLCTGYQVWVNSSDMGPGPVPNPWSFTTECGYVPASHVAIHRMAASPPVSGTAPPGWACPRPAKARIGCADARGLED